MKTILLKGGFVVSPEAVLRTDIVLRNDKIELSSSQASYDKIVDIAGKYVVPGFVDTHFHGYNLFDFTAGLFDPQSNTFDASQAVYENGLEMLSKTMVRFGVTGFYIATWAAHLDTLRNCYARLSDYLCKQQNKITGSKILGGCLEGSFINPAMCRAQNPDFVFEQSTEAFDSIEDNMTIKLASVVPDFGAKSCKLIEYLTEKGITVGFGHSAATGNQVNDGIKAGLKYCIHFLNAISSSTKIFDGGGSQEAVLRSEQLYAEQIMDGYHVDPACLRDVLKRKGVDKIIAATDCLFLTGSDTKEFVQCGIRGKLSNDGNFFHVAGRPDMLFSSNLTMDRGFENELSWLTTQMQGVWTAVHEPMEFEQAVVTTAKVFSTNTCNLTGLTQRGYGAIVEGAKADLCVLDITGSAGDYHVKVETTIVDGNIVYSAG